MALSLDSREKFVEEARVPEVAAAVLEVDRLVSRLFKAHFGDASDPRVQEIAKEFIPAADECGYLQDRPARGPEAAQ